MPLYTSEYFSELASVFMFDTTAGVPPTSTMIEPGRIDIVNIPLTSTPLNRMDDFTAYVNPDIAV